MTPFEQFAIGFDQRDRARLHELWDQVLDSHRWTESRMVDRFERLWAAGTGWAPSPSPAGRGRRWPRSSTPACGAGPCCAPPTRSWPRRCPSCRRGPRWPSWTATATTCACRSPTWSGRWRSIARARCGWCTSAATSPSRWRRSPSSAGPRGSSCWRTAPTPTARTGAGAGRAAGATPGSGRSTPPRRSPRARAACSPRGTRSCSTSPAAFATTASPTTAWMGSACG